MSAERERVLAAVRRALGDEPRPSGAAVAPPPGTPVADPVALFAERAAAHGARVARVDAATLPAALADACARHGVACLLAPPDLPEAWRPPGVALRTDAGADVATLDRIGAAVTASAGAIAATGSILFDGGRGQGRRALTLVPDLHLCVVEARSVHADVPDAIALLEAAAHSRSPVTIVSGPSATSDIELARVEGVHGPRRVEIFLLD